MPKKTTITRTRQGSKKTTTTTRTRQGAKSTKQSGTTRAPARTAKSAKSDQDKNTFCCTGLTESEFSKRLKKSTAHGKVLSEFCYLCGRTEGETSIGIQWKGDQPIACTAPIEMYSFERKVNDMKLVYNICLECGLLLDLPTEK